MIAFFFAGGGGGGGGGKLIEGLKCSKFSMECDSIHNVCTVCTYNISRLYIKMAVDTHSTLTGVTAQLT